MAFGGKTEGGGGGIQTHTHLKKGKALPQSKVQGPDAACLQASMGACPLVPGVLAIQTVAQSRDQVLSLIFK